MKRLISLVIAFAFVFSLASAFSFTATADFPSTDDLFGYENMCLTYTFNIKADSNGRHLVEDFEPYVAYYDTEGNIKDFFFDSFLFLPVNGYAPSGGTLHYDPGKPNKASDWEAYVEDTFYENANVNALNTAMGEAKKKLNDTNTKAGVVLTIMYPGWGDSNFGTLGGKKLDFNKLEDRKYAIKWMIDEQIKRFEDADYDHLELIGFYWLEEWIISWGYRNENLECYRYAGEYLESLGLKYIWIPYYQSTGYTEWQSYGFDVACMQPNMFWEDERDPQRVVNSVAESKKYGMGMEIEVDYRAISSTDYYERYLDYLEGGMNGGAMDTIKMYYQDGKPAVYYHAFNSGSKRGRSIYDLTYKYAKGTLTQADIDAHRAYDFEFPEGVDIVSKGKKYTHSGAYYSDGSSEYQQNDGKELTDGIIGTSYIGTEWHAFHVSLVDNEKRMSATIDLGETYYNLTHFGAHFNHTQDYGIGDPSDVRISVSTDGVTFKEIAQPELKFSGVTAWVEYVSNPVTARYVKFSFLKDDQNFIFCSEMYVGATGENVPNENPNPDPDPEPDPDPDPKPEPDGDVNVALNKDYEAIVHGNYTANLTDGVKADYVSYDENWFAFYNHPESEQPMGGGVNAPNRVGTVVIDLNGSFDISKVAINAGFNEGSGIAAPASVKVYLSDDGVNWGAATTLNIPQDIANNDAFLIEGEVLGTASYVKVDIALGALTFAFINEIEVYGTESSSTGPKITLGDVNNDGAVNQYDYILIKRHYFATRILSNTELLRADVNKDNKVDQYDYILVARHYFGTFVIK